MFKYFHIIIFLMTHDLTFLKECWQSEVIGNKKFTWNRLIRRYLESESLSLKYLLWWRLANAMYCNGNKKQVKIAKKIQNVLIKKYNMEIMLGAQIGKNIQLYHPSNIVITYNAEIGENFICLHNVTIGQNTDYPKIKIGNNCIIGTGTVVLGGMRTIGNNVTIGAMSLINKDIPDNCTVYTEKKNRIKINPTK